MRGIATGRAHVADCAYMLAVGVLVVQCVVVLVVRACVLACCASVLACRASMLVVRACVLVVRACLLCSGRVCCANGLVSPPPNINR